MTQRGLGEDWQNWQNWKKENKTVDPVAWIISTTMWPSSRQPHQARKRSGPVRNETVRRRRAARRFAMTRRGQEQEQTDSEVGRQEGARLVRVACGGLWGFDLGTSWETQCITSRSAYDRQADRQTYST